MQQPTAITPLLACSNSPSLYPGANHDRRVTRQQEWQTHALTHTQRCMHDNTPLAPVGVGPAARLDSLIRWRTRKYQRMAFLVTGAVLIRRVVSPMCLYRYHRNTHKACSNGTNALVMPLPPYVTDDPTELSLEHHVQQHTAITPLIRCSNSLWPHPDANHDRIDPGHQRWPTPAPTHNDACMAILLSHSSVLDPLPGSIP